MSEHSGDRALVDFVEGEPEAPETPMRRLPLRARLVFLAVLCLISGLLWGVTAFGLVPTEAQWPSGLAWGVRGLLAVAALTLATLTVVANSDAGSDRHASVAHVLLGLGWIGFSMTLVTDLVLRLPMVLLGIDNPLRSRVVATALLLLLVGLSLHGHREARRVPHVRRVEVPIRGLASALSGTTIAVLTDTHFDAWTTRRWADAVVARVNDLAPDLVVHAGDMADGSVAERGQQVEALAQVATPHRYSIAGNHEYYSGVDDWLGQMAGHGWRVLLNDHAVHGGDAAGLVIAGVDDPTGAGRGRGPDLDSALATAPDGRPVVLLAHQPHLIRTARDRVDLQISGHTHGGQIWPFHYLVRLREPVVQGLSRHGERTHLYTSRGTGFWGPPFRLFAPSEISLLTLVADR